MSAGIVTPSAAVASGRGSRRALPATGDNRACGYVARPWTDCSRPDRLAATNNHKVDRAPLHRHALRLLRRGGRHGRAHAPPARDAEQHAARPDFYNQLFSMHGTTMMFLFAVPVMQGFALYLVPLMVGTRNTRFPRMSACAYWLYLIGGLLLLGAFVSNTGADAGWFRTCRSRDRSTASASARLLEHARHLHRGDRADGRRRHRDRDPQDARARNVAARMPLFVWASLVTSVMIIFAMPMVMLARTSCSSTACWARISSIRPKAATRCSGSTLLVLRPPEVYFIFVPAWASSRRSFRRSRAADVRHDAIVLSLIATGFLSFGLWVHHMFATNVPELGKSFFTAMSFMIAIPTALQIFCWIATLWTGRSTCARRCCSCWVLLRRW
jgi:cytochrome c oxidase subunit 1